MLLFTVLLFTVLLFTVLQFAVLQFALCLIQVLTHRSVFHLTDIDASARIGATHALDRTRGTPLLAVSAILLVTSLAVFAQRTP